MKPYALVLPLSFAASLLAGCTQGPGTILKRIYLDQGGGTAASITTGARQRLITNTTTGVASGPGRVHARRIICVEPSPDVALAVANAFGVGISILGRGSGSLSTAQIEGVAQLAERTTAIQALLNQSYRACLDYANGAITGTTYSMRTSRLDDLLVTLVLAEQASGAFGRSGASIGTKASSEARASLTDLSRAAGNTKKLQKDLEKAELEVKEEEQEVAEAQSKFDSKNGKDDDPERKTLDKEKGELLKAEAKRDAILLQLKASSSTLTKAAAEVTSVTGVGRLTARPNAEVARVLGEMQARFLDKDVDQSYIATCLTELGHRKIATREDRVFRRKMLNNLLDSINNNVITSIRLEEFFLGSQLGDKNRLTKHCEEYLQEFVRISIQNRQIVKLKKLDIEKAKIALLLRQAIRKVIHPRSALNRLVEDNKILKDKQKILIPLAVPTAQKDSKTYTKVEQKELTTEKAALIIKIGNLIKEATKATGKTKRDDIDRLENKYLTLVTDVRKNGTTVQRRLLKAELDIQQAQAEISNEVLVKLSRQIRETTTETVDLIDRIKAIKP